MRIDELDRLHEHAGGTAAGVVDPAQVGLQHFDQELDHAARRVELAALLALGTGEPRQEVLVDAAEHIRGPGSLIAHHDVTDEIDNLAEPLLVERGAGVVPGQHALERRVVALYAGHRLVDELADCRLLCVRFELRPARLGRTQKMFSARYSSGSSGSAPCCSLSLSRMACFSSKASEIYFRKMRPRTTCLYSAASMLPRKASAMRHSSAS